MSTTALRDAVATSEEIETYRLVVPSAFLPVLRAEQTTTTR